MGGWVRKLGIMEAVKTKTCSHSEEIFFLAVIGL